MVGVKIPNNFKSNKKSRRIINTKIDNILNKQQKLLLSQKRLIKSLKTKLKK